MGIGACGRVRCEDLPGGGADGRTAGGRRAVGVGCPRGGWIGETAYAEAVGEYRTYPLGFTQRCTSSGSRLYIHTPSHTYAIRKGVRQTRGFSSGSVPAQLS